MVMRLLMVLAALLVTSPAWADHTAQNRQTDFSAFTMPQNQLRLGLFQEEYAIFTPWNVGTYLMPWVFIPITKSPILSAYTKIKFLDIGPEDHNRWAAAFKVNFLYANVQDLNLGSIEDGNFKAFVLPLTLSGSYVFDDVWTATLEATFVQTSLTGTAESTGDSNLLGVGAQKNFQLAAIGEMRLSRHVALNLVVRYAPWVEDLRLQSTAQVNASTTADIDASVSASAAQHAWLIQPGVTCSWGIFNLQAGVGYGNAFLPGLKMVGSVQTVIPDLDVYFRF